MASVHSVEAQILKVEGFQAHFYRNGQNVRSDTTIMVPPYPYVHAAKGAWTVMQWIQGRWMPTYSGWDVEVRTLKGFPISARHTILSTVRGR